MFRPAAYVRDDNGSYRRRIQNTPLLGEGGSGRRNNINNYSSNGNGTHTNKNIKQKEIGKGSHYEYLKKPWWTPAPATFKLIWTILYFLMAVAGCILVYEYATKNRGNDYYVDPFDGSRFSNGDMNIVSTNQQYRMEWESTYTSRLEVISSYFPSSECDRTPLYSLGLFALQLALNLGYVLVFFHFHKHWLSLFVVLALFGVVWKLVATAPILVGWILFPYKLWLGVAVVLNAYVAIYN